MLGSRQKLGEDYLRLEASEWRADAEMDSASEREVVSRNGPIAFAFFLQRFRRKPATWAANRESITEGRDTADVQAAHELLKASRSQPFASLDSDGRLVCGALNHST